MNVVIDMSTINNIFTSPKFERDGIYGNIRNNMKNHIAFILILIFGLSFRVCVWSKFLDREDTFIQIDTMSYLKPGIELIEHGSFSSFARTPIYPLFLGAAYKFISDKYSNIALLQIAISMTTILIVYITCLQIFNRKIAILSILFLSFDFYSIITANFLMSETLFTFILSLSTLGLIIFVKHNRSYIHELFIVSLIGFCLAILSLCRPISIVFFLTISFWLFLFHRNRKKYILNLIICLSLCSCSLPLAWTIRNYIHTGVYFFTTISSTDLFLYRAAWNISNMKGESFYKTQQIFKAISEDEKKKNGWNEGELARWEKKEGLKILKSSPWLTIKQGIEGLIKMYFVPSLKEMCLLQKDKSMEYSFYMNMIARRDVSYLNKISLNGLLLIIYIIFFCLVVYTFAAMSFLFN
ncbi:glycosyltransferase family 39 protein, partial [Desulfobulbus sp. F3]|nr:glycosyltransferase family 39 protein [Desulfobulbus sp. F3]